MAIFLVGNILQRVHCTRTEIHVSVESFRYNERFSDKNLCAFNGIVFPRKDAFERKQSKALPTLNLKIAIKGRCQVVDTCDGPK